MGDRHTPLPQRRLSEQDVLTAGIPAQRDHRRVLEEEEVLLPAGLHEAGALVLDRRRFGVVDAPEELVVAATHQTISVNFPSCRVALMCATNWSATAPSMSLWSNDSAR